MKVTRKMVDACISAASEEARREAVKEGRRYDYRFVRSRGRFLAANVVMTDGREENVVNSAECLTYNGVKGIHEVIELAKERVARDAAFAKSTGQYVVYVEGGYDTSPDITFDDYEPWASNWSCVVWKDGALFEDLPVLPDVREYPAFAPGGALS